MPPPAHTHTALLSVCPILTPWGRVTHICVGKLTIIGSDNGLSPDQHKAIIWTNAGILLIGPFGTNFSDILIEFLTFSFKKMRLKVSSAKWRPFCLGLNVLTGSGLRNRVFVVSYCREWEFHITSCGEVCGKNKTSRHLLSHTNLITDLSPWASHPRIYKIAKLHLRRSTGEVKHLSAEPVFPLSSIEIVPKLHDFYQFVATI